MESVAQSDGFALPIEVVEALRGMNPWWQGDPLPVLPATRRHLVAGMRRRLTLSLAPIVVLRGPRQIGKTTAQFHLISDLLGEGVDPRRILRVQFDEMRSLGRLESPILRIQRWFEREVLGKTLNAAAHAGEKAYLFFDEVQNLRDWDAQLKSLVDHGTVSVVVTGSSALRIERGRDSLAGRITTLEGGVLSLREIAEFAGLDLEQSLLAENGLGVLRDRSLWLSLREQGEALVAARDESFRRFSERGGYPLAQVNFETPWDDVADQLNETVVRRVIQQDLRLGDRGRRRNPDLLEEVFRLACRYAGQAPGPQLLADEAQRALGANVGVQRIRSYLRFLDDALLVRRINPLEIRLKRRRGNPKLCLADHGLRASWLQEVVPLDAERLRQAPETAALAGRVAESVAGACLSNMSGLQVAHFPARSGLPEVDFVLTVGDSRIPVEVKYQARIDPLRDTAGLRTFVENRANRAPFGILVTQGPSEVNDPRIVSLPLSSFLLLR